MARVLEKVDPPVAPSDPTNIPLLTLEVVNGDAASGKAPVSAHAYLDAAGDVQVVAPSSPLPTTPAPGRNTYGSAVGVAMGATVAVVSFIADAAFKFRGFVGSGDGDGTWRVAYDGAPQYMLRTNVASLTVDFRLANPDAAAGGHTVTIEVTNNGTGAATFEATILGE